MPPGGRQTTKRAVSVKVSAMALDSLLWRSRGTKGWVRAVPGAPPAAAEGMDSPDVRGRATESPVGGKGLTVTVTVTVTVTDHRGRTDQQMSVSIAQYT